jgi:hypothetical protein
VPLRPRGTKTVGPYSLGLAELEPLARADARRHSLRAGAGVIDGYAVSMHLDQSSPVECAAVEQAARAWPHRHDRTMAKGAEQTKRKVSPAQLPAGFDGRSGEPARTPKSHLAELEAYRRQRTEERGVAQTTVIAPPGKLLQAVQHTAGKTLIRMRLRDVEAFGGTFRQTRMDAAWDQQHGANRPLAS